MVYCLSIWSPEQIIINLNYPLKYITMLTFLHNFLYFAKFIGTENIVNCLHKNFNTSHKPYESFQDISLKGSPTLMTVSLLVIHLVSTNRFQWSCHDEINLPIFRSLSNGGITIFFNWYSGGWSPIGSTRHCGHQ
jgi:hypothetical protein